MKSESLQLLEASGSSREASSDFRVEEAVNEVSSDSLSLP